MNNKIEDNMQFGLPSIVIEQIQAVFARHLEVEKVVLYGSRAKKTYKNGSDIDLSLLGDNITSLIESAIRSDLDDLMIPYIVDLSIFQQINNEQLKEHIEHIGQIFYQKKCIKPLIVTSALPYANGDIHLGHLMEHIQADIWVRYQKMIGRECYFICADDAHGTAISIKAKEQNIDPEDLINKSYNNHLADLSYFDIEYDNYYTTHSQENKDIVCDIYEALNKNGKIYTKTIKCFYDEVKGTFLADRFIKGQCPKCNAQDQYGDNCSVCGATYDPIELVNPYSTLSKTTPVLKDSEHYFVKFSDSADLLKGFLSNSNFLSVEINRKMHEWLQSGLKDWDISRDEPYFGIQIPNTDKFFYVWLDAPVGYLSSFVNYCNKNNINNPIEIWNGSEIYHFIGKDIVYFHALFWPFMLHYAGYKIPTSIFVHGFLQVNGQKMSKSTGNFITARQYIEQNINTDFFRYYIASKINGKIDDINFSYEEFIQKVNTDVVGKFVNILARSSSFLAKKFDNTLSNHIEDTSLITQILSAKTEISEYYQNMEYSKLITLFMKLAEIVNQYFDIKTPWVIAKNETRLDELHQIITVIINSFKILAVYIKPVMPKIAQNISELLDVGLTWESLTQLLLDHKIKPYQHLASRI